MIVWFGICAQWCISAQGLLVLMDNVRRDNVPQAKCSAGEPRRRNGPSRSKAQAHSAGVHVKNSVKYGRSTREWSMFVNLNINPAGRLRFLGELTALAETDVLLSEFKYNRGAEIFGEAEPAEFVYQVIDGGVRSYKLLSDGRRQINAFHLIGDIFGLENGETHRFTAEAIVETTVRLTRRASLAHIAETD